MILPRADAHEARARMETICRDLAAHPLPTRGGARYVTLSAGLALWPEQGLVLDELLQVADAALYKAKHAGRNRVCSLV